ncbi:abortive infection family protein [Celeribacter halophilus]|uniref:abortive infection family protein n=1 Tax=Celeribacter halophilus TaxID=576117 RepID=UPI003A93C390
MTIYELLDQVQVKHPNFEALNNLLTHFAYDEYTPDALIDLSHSLNEGAAKNFRLLVDRGEDEKKIEGQTNTSKHWNVVRKGLATEIIDADLLKSLHAFFERVRKMRNKHGDLAHGHIGPKRYTTEREARFIFDLSIAHSRYVFACAEEIESEQIPYDKYSEFNDYLDDQGERLGRMPYSRLVYDHDYDRYVFELEEFNPDIYA